MVIGLWVKLENGEVIKNSNMTDEEWNLAYLESLPKIISMRQFRLALFNIGQLDAINTFVKQMPVKAQIEWEVSNEVWRSSPMVEQMRVMFSWTVEQMDAMFVSAQEL